MDDDDLQCDKRDDIANDAQTSSIDFRYEDADVYSVEIAECYSYSEESDCHRNRKCFETLYHQYSNTKWFDANEADRRAHFIRLMDRLDSAQCDTRRNAIRSILYLAQGNFGECQLEEDQIIWTRRNVYMALELGLFHPLVQTLLFEIEYDDWSAISHPNSNAPTKEDDRNTNPTDPTPINQTLTTMSASSDLRALLSLLYIIIETIRYEMLASSNGSCSGTLSSNNPPSSQDRMAKLREQFCDELSTPITGNSDTTLCVVLFGMVHRFCSGLAPHFPMRKVLLVLWKITLVTLGPITAAFSVKNAIRARWNLPPLTEDSNQVVRRLRACSPPGTSVDHLLSRANPQRANARQATFGQGNQTPKRGSLAGGRSTIPVNGSGPRPQESKYGSIFHLRADRESEEIDAMFAIPELDTPCSRSPANEGDWVDTPLPGSADSQVADADSSGFWSVWQNVLADHKSLPWKPKVYKRDLEAFLTSARMKFVKFQVPNDVKSLMGLPEPIHEAVRVLQEHIYVPLSEVQIQREIMISCYPLTMGRDEISDTPAERLYRSIYSQLPHYMIALLRILLAAVPTSKIPTEPINILAEMTPDTLPTDGLQMSMHCFDIYRHREIIVKAISALLLLLLKHFKMNHVYQFEYISQYLVFANCIPLILKFFNQNTSHYVHAKNTLSFLNFPARLIGNPPEITSEMLMSDVTSSCWRNLFACINLLRVLNMLTKWKSSRIMLLVVFKSAPILKRALRVRHAMLQLYVLKLLKLQSRYFGRQWRKNNMSTMSAIYQKVRHRFVDDWAYGNDTGAVPLRFQIDEQALRTCLDHFNQRRYSTDDVDPVYQSVDNCLGSILSKPFPLSDEFKQNYEKWLEEEVFSVPIDWSKVLAH